MELTDDCTLRYGQELVYARLWEDKTNGKEPPVVVIEPGAQGYTGNVQRADLATDIAKTLGTTPDKLSWYEMKPDGAMKEYSFQPYSFEHRPYANDLSRNDYEAAEKQGLLKPTTITAYRTNEKDVTPEAKQELQGKFQDPLESFEQKQNRVHEHKESLEQKPIQELRDVSFSHSRSL